MPLQTSRVLIVPEYASSGGTLTFFQTLLEIHQKNDIETAVLIPPEQNYPHVVSKIESCGAKIFFGPKILGKHRSAFFAKNYVSLLYDLMFCAPTTFKWHPDLITVINGSPRMMVGAMLLPQPVVYIMQTYPLQTFRLPMKWVARLCAAMPKNKMVTVSHFSTQRIQNMMGVNSQKVRVIYNSYRENAELAETVLGEKNAHSQLVLNASHVEDWKGPECWLETARKVLERRPQTQFRWMGIGSRLEQMRHSVNALGLHAQVAFAGYDANIHKHLGETAVYFQPSRIENHSMAVADAMARGLPCVVSNVGGMPEAVIDGITGYVCPDNDADAFADRIIHLLDDAQLRARLGAAGKNRAQAIFSEAVQAKGYLEVYEELIKK